MEQSIYVCVTLYSPGQNTVGQTRETESVRMMLLLTCLLTWILPGLSRRAGKKKKHSADDEIELNAPPPPPYRTVPYRAVCMTAPVALIIRFYVRGSEVHDKPSVVIHGLSGWDANPLFFSFWHRSLSCLYRARRDTGRFHIHLSR